MHPATTDPILDAIIARAQADPRIDVLWLYGSRAKGSAEPHSDYDLAVAFKSFPDDAWEKRLQPARLAFEWSDALGLEGGKLSVVDINHIPLPLAYAIVQSGRVLQASNRLRLAREENRITSMWELDHVYHRRHFG